MDEEWAIWKDGRYCKFKQIGARGLISPNFIVINRDTKIGRIVQWLGLHHAGKVITNILRGEMEE